MMKNNYKQRTLRTGIYKFARLVCVSLWCLLILGQMGRYHWALDLLSHFGGQIVPAIAISSLFLLCARERAPFVLAAIAFLLLAPAILWYYWPSRRAVVSEEHLRVVSSNVLTRNQNKSGVVRYLKEMDADLVVLLEISPEWASAIADVKELFPYQEIHDRQDNFGIAMLSKFPLLDVEILRLDSSGVPTIDAQIEINGQRLRVIGTHPRPPMGAEEAAQRNEHLTALAHTAKAKPLPTLVIGDLNCTSWSYYFRRFLEQSELQDSRKGLGVQPSWPVGLGWLRIPIDHALVSEGIEVRDRQTGPNIGSDHLPIVIDLQLR